MFVRFVVSDRHEQSGELRGLFSALYRLQREGQLSTSETQWFEEIEAWFNKHLRAPDRLSSKPSAPKTAITWLKASANEHVRRMRELVTLLAHKDVLVEELKTDRPGYILYEDEYQVAAVPFRTETF